MDKKLEYRHYPGGSCACVAWSEIFRQHGHNLSESDIFGLGSGIYFGYCAIGISKIFDISLTSSSLINDLFLNTGVYGKLFQFSDKNICFNKILQSIDNGYPVAVQLNPYSCKELIKATSSNMHKYLPAHWIVVIGYNSEKKVLIINDNRQFNPIEISYEDFIAGRSSGLSDQNPRNFYYNIYFFNELYPIDMSVKLALRKAYVNFFEVQKILAFYTGAYGFEKFIRQLGVLNKFIKENQLVELLQKFKLSITGAGGIKGGYRLLYANYLVKVSEILQDARIKSASQHFFDSAYCWNLFIDELTKYELNPDKIKYFEQKSELSNILQEIYKNENQAFTYIKNVIN